MDAGPITVPRQRLANAAAFPAAAHLARRRTPEATDARAAVSFVSMPSCRRSLTVVLALLLLCGTARADDARPDASYLWDGGALPFIWGALGARIALDRYAQPRESPLVFSASEGGAARPEWQVPGWGVTAGGGVLAVAMLAGGDGSRWYHLKGLAESLSTGVTVTGALKVTFARHRPVWDADTDRAGDRRSFPSGHATQAFAIATYAAAYLRLHVFDELRESGEWPAYEIATYLALYSGATAVAAERVIHNQHHVTDVLAGAALGTASSLLFFRYQERRFRRGRGREELPQIIPSVRAGGATIRIGWTW